MEETYPKFAPLFLNDEGQLEDAVDSNNGLCLAKVYIPIEILLSILTYMDPTELLKCSLVCRKWNDLIKSYTLWSTFYRRKYNRKAKKLPWYLYYCLLTTNYFNTNLLVNGNGQDGFNNWKIDENQDEFCVIEDPPFAADPLPLNVPEFNNKTSCFVTSYSTSKTQSIKLEKSPLFEYILDNYKPHVYVSEWIASRFDCSCMYTLRCTLTNKASDVSVALVQHNVMERGKWKKIEVTFKEYPEEVEEITFEHAGRHAEFWAGNGGSKMAGGVVKFLFDSIVPLPTDKHGNKIPKTFSKVPLKSNVELEEGGQRIIFHMCGRFSGH